MYKVEPGNKLWPFHTHHANEEWVIVFRGEPTLRTHEGEQVLREGDVVAFPRGNEGAHQIRNDTDAPIRVLMLSTTIAPDIVEYLDTRKIGARSVTGDRIMFDRPGPELEYWEGEDYELDCEARRARPLARRLRPRVGAEDVDAFVACFTEDAVYQWGPSEEPLRGHERSGRTEKARGAGRHPVRPRAARDHARRPRDRALAGVGARTPPRTVVELEGIFLVTLDADGLCTDFREWFNVDSRPAGR